MTQRSPDELSHYKSGRARRFYIGLIWSSFNTLIPASLGLIVFLLVSRVISPEELGLVAFAIAVVSAIGAFSPAGFGDALVQKADLVPSHLNATFWLCLLWSILLYAVTAVLAGPMAAILGDPMMVLLMPVIGLRLIFDLAAVVPTALLSRNMQFRQVALRTLVSSLVSLVVCLVVLGLGYGIWALVMSQLIGASVLCAVSWLSIAWRPSWGIDRQAIRDLCRFGGFASGSRLITTVSVEQLLIGTLLGAASLGLFSFARRIFQMVSDMITGALAAVSYPLMSSMQNEPEKLRETYQTTTFFSAVLSFPLFTGLALVGDQVIILTFGAQWQDAMPALQAFCAIGLLSCIGVLQSALIRAKGRADWWMWYQIVQQILTALVVVILYPYGVSVVVIGIAVKTWIVWPFFSAAIARMIGLSFARYISVFFSPFVACLVMAAVVLSLKYHMVLDTAVASTALIATGALAYGLTMLIVARRRLAALRHILRKGR